MEKPRTTRRILLNPAEDDCDDPVPRGAHKCSTTATDLINGNKGVNDIHNCRDKGMSEHRTMNGLGIMINRCRSTQSASERTKIHARPGTTGVSFSNAGRINSHIAILQSLAKFDQG